MIGKRRRGRTEARLGEERIDQKRKNRRLGGKERIGKKRKNRRKRRV